MSFCRFGLLFWWWGWQMMANIWRMSIKSHVRVIHALISSCGLPSRVCIFCCILIDGAPIETVKHAVIMTPIDKSCKVQQYSERHACHCSFSSRVCTQHSSS